MDPPPLCDERGQPASREDSCPLPSFAWRWLGDWLPEPAAAAAAAAAAAGMNRDNDDATGWLYALSFSGSFAPVSTFADCVRKRVLYRRRWLGMPATAPAPLEAHSTV